MKKKILSIFMLLTFALMIVACDKKPIENPDQKVFDQAYQALTIVPGSDLDKVTNSFDVSTTLRGGVTAKWTSDKPATAAIQEGTEGTARVVVTRPESDQADVTVKLTAKVTYKEITKDKEFTIVVLKKPVITGGYTIAQLRSGAAELDSVVTISSEVTIVGLAYNGYTVFDGTTALFVFTSTAPSLKVGDKGVLYGTFAVGFDTNYQLTNATFEKTEEVENITAPEVAIKDLWLGALENDAAVLERHSGENSVPNFVTVEGKVALRKDLASSGNYQLVVFDTAEDTATSTKNFVRLYYRDPLFSELYALQGKEVKLTLTVNSIRRDRNTSSQDYVYEMNITSYQLLEELTDQEKVNVDIEVLELNTTFIKNGNLNLVTKGVQGSTIGYTFKDASDVNNALINLETGEVVLPTEGQVKVVIVATAKMNDATKSKDITITIGEVPLVTIAEANAKDKGETVRVKGVVLKAITSVQYGNSSVYIQDETGRTMLYRVAKDHTSKLIVGREIEVEGSIGVFGYVNQIENVKITLTDTPIISIEPTQIDNELTEQDIYKFAEISGTFEAITKEDDKGSITYTLVKGEVKYTGYFAGSMKNDLGEEVYNAIVSKIKSLQAGDEVTLVGIVGHYNKTPQMLVFSTEDIKINTTTE
ncbi:MAG: hypothetical protein GX312_02625 [Candidatus Phytoplasma sp.]|nr:hypothetical protein [Phytoplasma sp.]